MSPSKGICTLTKVKSFSSSMACNSGTVTSVYVPPSIDTNSPIFSPVDGGVEALHAAVIKVPITRIIINTLFIFLFSHVNYFNLCKQKSLIGVENLATRKLGAEHFCENFDQLWSVPNIQNDDFPRLIKMRAIDPGDHGCVNRTSIS